MIPEERRNKILDELQQKGVYAVDDLARSLEVSRITVQRDITLLVERGLVEKIHGGVKLKKNKGLNFETVFEKRLNQQYEAKMEIAEKALSVVRDHSTIFIDSSTTCYIFARELLKRRYLDLGIITNSPAVQLEALGYPDSKIISTGGELRQNFNMLAGKWVIEFMMRVNIDAAFISTAGVSSEWNLTTSNAELAEILATVFGRTDEVNLLVDSSKFFKAGMLNIGSISRCRRVISNSEIDSRLLADIERMHGLEMIC
jgi:DeoR/GlpR family transcriptional regulator of sugar metabolism